MGRQRLGHAVVGGGLVALRAGVFLGEIATLFDLGMAGKFRRRLLREIAESVIRQWLQAEARPLPENLDPGRAGRVRELGRQRMHARIEPQLRPFF